MGMCKQGCTQERTVAGLADGTRGRAHCHPLTPDSSSKSVSWAADLTSAECVLPVKHPRLLINKDAFCLCFP